MKIQLISDLHMEFAPIEITNAGADTLILSGDIVVADHFTRGEASPKRALADYWTEWFEATCAQFEHVIYVLGNHEHYNGTFQKTFGILNEALGHIRNLRILDNSVSTFEGVTFIGTTLWTDFENDNFKMMLARDAMNDYKIIKSHNYRKLAPVETTIYYAEAMRLIEAHTHISKRIVVCGHHGPSYSSISEEYQGSSLNSAYVSHLDRFIEAHPQIVLWTHGHVHSSHDYMIGDTRIVANPRGYANPKSMNFPENRNFNPNLILEI